MAKRPNILFLITDHTNGEALAPASPCRTPNLDALAGEGLRFRRCYTTNAICSPARASLMTGTYPSTHGMWDCTHTQRREWVDVPEDRFTYFSHRLDDAGYRLGYFGKWHVEQTNELERFGWHEYVHQCAWGGNKAAPGTELVVPKEGYRDYLLAGVADPGSETHAAFDKGIDFIRRHLQGEHKDDPFCCFVSTAEPHDAYIPPRRFFEMYDLDEVPLPASLRDECADKPEVVRRLREEWTGLSEADWRRMRAAYWALITWLDSEVGRILDALRELNVYEETIIVFTADHGDMLGAHGLTTKGVGTGYEEVYNIPLVVRVPGCAARGEAPEVLTSLVDLGPTLLDFCHAEPLPQCHGRSLRPVLEGTYDPAAWREAYAEFFGQRFVYTQRLVWDGDWKFVFNPGGIDELYDLAEDPTERRNLAQDPAHRDRLVEMTKRMWRKMKAIGDDSLYNTHYATLRTAVVGPAAAD